MAKNMFSKGFALAVLALSAIEQADAFVVKPSGFHGTSTELSESPKFIKRGQKVETEVDFGILVQAVGYLGAGVVALGILVLGPQNGGLPEMNLPFTSVSTAAVSKGPTTIGKQSAPSNIERKVVEAKRLGTAGYDLELEDEVRLGAGSGKVAAFDRAATTKKDEEARAAARAKVEAAGAERKAAGVARQAEADEKQLKLASERAEKMAVQAKTQEERAAKQNEVKVIAEKEREVAAEARKAEQAEKKAKSAEQTATKQSDAAAIKAVAGGPKAAKEEAAAKAKQEEAELKAIKEAEVKAVNKAEDKAAKVVVPVPVSAPPASSDSALGKVSGTESGGKVLQKEEVSADVLNTLKKYN